MAPFFKNILYNHANKIIEITYIFSNIRVN